VHVLVTCAWSKASSEAYTEFSMSVPNVAVSSVIAE
jgi:hypothetical protein